MGDTAPRFARRDRDPARGVPAPTGSRRRATAARGLRPLSLAVVLVAAACGGGGDKAAVTTTTTTAAPATTTSAPTTSTSVAPHVVDAAGVATTWIQAIADGDHDR